MIDDNAARAKTIAAAACSRMARPASQMQSQSGGKRAPTRRRGKRAPQLWWAPKRLRRTHDGLQGPPKSEHKASTEHKESKERLIVSARLRPCDGAFRSGMVSRDRAVLRAFRF